jgi:DNA polymerase-3 subunit gamma/tau
VVQLWYQMALNGRRDLYLAPSPRAGFEMAVLRMLAFRPAAAVPPVPRDPGTGTEVGSRGGTGGSHGVGAVAAAPVVAAAAPPAAVAPAAPKAAPVVEPPAPAPVPAPSRPAAPQPAAPAVVADPDDLPPWHQDGAADDRDEALAAEMATPDAAMVAPWEAPPERPAAPAAVPPRPQGIAIAPSPVANAPAVAVAAADAPIGLASAEAWLELVAQSQLNGPSRQLAAHAAFIGYQRGVLKLAVSPGFEYLCSDRSLAALTDALTGPLGQAPKIVIEAGGAEAETLHQRSDRQRGERQQAAEAVFMADPDVQLLVQQHGARVVTDSIRPFDE